MIGYAHPKPVNRFASNKFCPLDADAATQQETELASSISQRIRAHLPGRVRCLTVCVTEKGVTLTGQCSTYYSKQMAQHVAMGALDYQQLVNNIDVQAGR